MDVQYFVRIGEHLSAPFTLRRGVKQGDPMSPILFVLFVNQCLNKANPLGVSMPGLSRIDRVRGLMYADNLHSLSSSQEGVEESLKKIYEWGLTDGMELGRNKCGIILWDGDHPRWIRPRAPQPLDLDNQMRRRNTMLQPRNPVWNAMTQQSTPHQRE
jgi:Reverse transcriptase (RNA-dependent DNA polymerase)